jgi:hypothetical protein
MRPLRFSSRGTALLIVALAGAWTAGEAQAKKYAPPKGAPTATIRVEFVDQPGNAMGRNYAAAVVFAREDCDKLSRRQQSLAWENLKDDAQATTAAQPVQAGKPLAMSFLYVGTRMNFSRNCQVDGTVTFAPGTDVVATFRIELGVSACSVTFTPAVAGATDVMPTHEIYEYLCQRGQDHDARSGVGRAIEMKADVHIIH